MEDLVLQLDPDERILYTVRRSIVGVAPYIVLGVLTLVGLLVGTYIVARYPERVDGLGSQPMALLVVLVGGALIELIVYLIIRTYFRNVLILTNESIVQRLVLTPFSNNISQLDLGRIEDVTVKQNGFFATIFNFGTLMVETAGEQANFIFKFARKPNKAAKAIIAAHEDARRGHNQASPHPQNATPGSQPSQPSAPPTAPPQPQVPDQGPPASPSMQPPTQPHPLPPSPPGVELPPSSYPPTAEPPQSSEDGQPQPPITD